MTTTTPLPDAARAAVSILGRAEQLAPPVDLVRVVSLWPGLRITEENLEGAGYYVDLGRLGGEILVRRADPPRRQRYTIAHELGHLFLRQNLPQLQQDGLQGAHEAGRRRSLVERWCDAFAAALLMPEPWVRRDLRSKSLPGILARLIRCPNRYDVSHEALRLRAAEVTRLHLFDIVVESSRATVQTSYDSRRSDRTAVPALLDCSIPGLVAADTNLDWTDQTGDHYLAARLTYRHGDARRWLLAILPRLLGNPVPERTCSSDVAV